MAEADKAVGPDDVDAEIQMIEVEFKTTKFGLKKCQVEADSSALDATLSIVAAIEDRGREAVYEEFDEPENSDDEEGSAEKKAKSATSRFILSWENAADSTPLNKKVNMGDTLSKREGPLYVFEHDPQSELGWKEVNGNLTGFYPPQPGRKGFSAKGAASRARKLNKKRTPSGCMPDPEGSGWASRLFRIMTGRKRVRVFDAPPRRLRLKRKVKLVSKASQFSPEEHSIDTQTSWNYPEKSVQAAPRTHFREVQTGTFQTAEEIRLQEENKELKEQVANAEKLREEAEEMHKPCAGVLAKAMKDLERARNESSLADHGVCHQSVQTDVSHRMQRPKPPATHIQAKADAGPRPQEHQQPPSIIPEMPGFFSFWSAPASEAQTQPAHAASQTPPAAPASAAAPAPLGKPHAEMEPEQHQKTDDFKLAKEKPGRTEARTDFHKTVVAPPTAGTAQDAGTDANKIQPGQAAPAEAQALHAAAEAGGSGRHPQPAAAAAGSSLNIFKILPLSAPEEDEAATPAAAVDAEAHHDDRSDQQLEIQRLRAEIAELKKRKQTPAGLAGFTDITYLFSAPEEGSGAEEKEAEQDVPKGEGQEEKPKAAAVGKAGRPSSVFKLFSPPSPDEDEEKRRLRAEVKELKEALLKDNKLLASLSSVSGSTASKVKKALADTSAKPRWVQELTADGKPVFIDRKTGRQQERLSRSELITDGAFLWAPFSEEENKRDRLHLQMRADKLLAETTSLREQARGHEELSESLRQQLATAEAQLRLRAPGPAPAEEASERGRERERDREQALRQALEAEIARHKGKQLRVEGSTPNSGVGMMEEEEARRAFKDISQTGYDKESIGSNRSPQDGAARQEQELEEARETSRGLRSALDINQARHRETCERLDEERKKSAGKDDELQALHARLASQNRALVEQLETIEQAARSASRATVDLEVMSAVAKAKAHFQ